MNTMIWRKSSYSTTGGNCVEVSFAYGVAVRDSKNTTGSTLRFSHAAWSRFLRR
jgi:hypothetical protein